MKYPTWEPSKIWYEDTAIFTDEDANINMEKYLMSNHLNEMGSEPNVYLIQSSISVLQTKASRVQLDCINAICIKPIWIKLYLTV